jgi:hypothetical protein
VKCSRFRICSGLFFSLVASAALVIIADQCLFRWGTWPGWTLARSIPGTDEAAWWESRVGPLPAATDTGAIVTPASMRGRDGSVGDGAPGLHGQRLPHGFGGYEMQTRLPLIRGGVLIATDLHAWRAGVELPGGMVVDRYYVGQPGVAPPHPTYGQWDVRLLPIGFVLNTLYAAGPLCILAWTSMWIVAATSRRIRARVRRRRGQCPACAYILLPEQAVCPECGRER